MTATIENETAYRYDELPLSRIHPSETNRKIDDVEGLKTSILEVGLLQPILVRPWQSADGEQYEIIAGERRWLAFTQLGREKIPALIGPETTDTMAFLAQLIENLQREDLDPLFEGYSYQQLLDVLECNQHELAGRIGVSQATISKKLSLITLPKAAIASLDSQRITFTEAVELARLTEHPEVLEHELEQHLEQTERGFNRWSIKERVDAALEVIKERAEFDAHVDKLRDAGVTIYPHGSKAKYAFINKPHRTPAALNINVDERKHKKEPCRAVLIDETYHRRQLEEVCSDSKRHDANGESKLKTAVRVTYGSTREPVKKTDAEKKAAAKKRENDKARREFMVGMVTRRAPDNLWRVVSMRVITGYMAPAVVKLACELLNLKVPEKGYHRYEDTLRKFARKGDAELVRALHAVTLSQGEHNGYAYSKDHQALLKAAGFKGKATR